MGSENRFVYNPSTVDIGRSKFMMNSFWKGSVYHGDLVPVEIIDCLPGDSIKYDVSAFIRTATPPIAPFMDTIQLSIAGFLVPKRLIWSKEKEFLGENTEGYGIQSEVLAPRTGANYMAIKTTDVASIPRSIGSYLGLVRQDTSTLYDSDSAKIALNPVRAYLQVYNDWFRNENFHAPYLWDHSQTGDGANRDIATLNGSGVNPWTDVPQVCKKLDRYTSCLPWAQKGSPVTLPLGEVAPVIGQGSTLHDVGTGGFIMSNTHSLTGNKNLALHFGNDATDKGYVCIDESSSATAPLTNLVTYTNMVADLSDATAASINELRLAFATQKYLEALARSGSKYREYIKGMFGVNIGDTTAQMAEYLGGMTIDLNIDQVLQSTGYAAGGSTTLGAPGASSTSAASSYLFTKSVEEPSYLVIVAYTKHNRTYGQGLEDMWFKHDVLEDYNPKFANIGEQAIRTDTIYFDGRKSKENDRFGFQEAWSEYRHIKDKVVGLLCPTNSSSFNFWSLADNFASAPTLNASFLTEDRTNITRVLAGGSSSPDYFLDIKFKRTFVRPMPLYSIPGLIDHH